MKKIIGASLLVGGIFSFLFTKVAVLATPQEIATIVLITFPLMSIIVFFGICWAIMYKPKPKQRKKSGVTGFVGVRIGPLVIGEQIGTPEVKVKKED